VAGRASSTVQCLLLLLWLQTAKDVVSKVVQELGRLDVLVNNASEQHVRKELSEITPEQLQKTFATNVYGYFYMAQVSRRPACGEHRRVSVAEHQVFSKYRPRPAHDAVWFMVMPCSAAWARLAQRHVCPCPVNSAWANLAA